MVYVTDTHALVWYFSEDSHLGKKALDIFESTVKEGLIIIPVLVLAEILYISKKGKITLSFQETLQKIENSDNFSIAQLDLNILKIADKINIELEMHDRLIAATALYFDAPLITKDRKIKDSKACKIVW